MNTPVLLLVYNRPDKTRRVLERLAELGVSKIYVSGDGPKNRLDSIMVENVKSVIEDFHSIVIDTQFSNQNLGCKNGVIKGIDWFFKNVEEGIILEDDCLPNQSFFRFCKRFLTDYREEKTVSMISGHNPLGNWPSENDYFFSRIGHVWGWATWKNRWQGFNPNLPNFQRFVEAKGFKKAFGPTNLAKNRLDLSIAALSGEIDTWDYQWNTHLLMSGGLAVLPSKNMIDNIGFDAAASHTIDKSNWISSEVFELDIPQTKAVLLPTREYEMDLYLAQRADKPANKNSTTFHQIGQQENSALKIAIVNSADSGGGAEKIALQLHQRLIDKGHDSRLFVSTKKSNLSSVNELEKNWQQQITAYNPDVIHVHNLHGTEISITELAKFSHQYKTLFTLHDSWLTTGSINHPFILSPLDLDFLSQKQWKSELRNRVKSISDAQIRFTAPSQWLRERFFKSHTIRAYFVPNSSTKFAKSTEEINSNRFALFVANRAESNPYKDFETLRLGWEMANEQLKEQGIDLVCIGCSEEQTIQIGNNRFICLHRMDSESISAYLDNCLFAIQASKQDNAPLGIIEAHQANKKVLASLVGGIPEMLDNEEQSWMFQPEDVKDLGRQLLKVVKLIDDNIEIYKVTSPTSFSEIVDMYLGHYRDLVNG